VNTEIAIKKLTPQDCTLEAFSKFNRYQQVKRCWRKEDGKWRLADIPFTEDWNDAKKAVVIDSLRRGVQQGGVLIAALSSDDIIGFSSISNQLFGARLEYIQLEMLHVSYEFRNRGIGKDLFRAICSAARELSVKKLYISAHSSEDSQAFYKSIGCVEAVELNQKLFEAEPFDVHMEYIL